MTGTSNWQFGLIAAYVLPGFIALAGLAPFFPSVAGWLRPAGPGLGAPLYAILASAAAGLIVSCFRWLILDQIHRRSGLTPPAWDDSQLKDVLGTFDYLVQNHYRYYEFSGNTLLAALFAYGANRLARTSPLLGVGTDLAMLVISLVLFTASRDALAKYYTRTGRLIGRIAEKGSGRIAMFNGNDHAHEGGQVPASPPQPQKPQVPAKPQKDEPKATPAQK